MGISLSYGILAVTQLGPNHRHVMLRGDREGYESVPQVVVPGPARRGKALSTCAVAIVERIEAAAQGFAIDGDRRREAGTLDQISGMITNVRTIFYVGSFGSGGMKTGQPNRVF